MEEEADLQFGFVSASAYAAFPCTPVAVASSRRLSSQFTPSRPVHSVRKLAWVSLQGRVVNAEEASSARAIGGGLSREEAVAWELFSPAQRFLIVAVIGVAAAESKKNRLISQLKKSVELRDEVLSSMQQKLDNLCEQQLGNVNNQGGARGSLTLNRNVESLANDAFGCDKIKFVECGCWHCDQHQHLFGGLTTSSAVKVSKGDEMLHYKMPFVHEVEQDERRMSDLSDWASTTSTIETQMNTFAIDQDIFNLKKECEEKDVAIKDLTTILQSTNMAGSKRIAELEDIIRRKNTMITRLKKDMAVLEQKVVHLTRLRRPSTSPTVSEGRQIPAMTNNIIYDMDSTTSPSSSDSDSRPANRLQATTLKVQLTPIPDSKNSPSSSDSDSSPVKRWQDPVVEIHETPTTDVKFQSPIHQSELASVTNQKLPFTKASRSLVKSTEHLTNARSASPLKEISTNQKTTRNSPLKLKQSSTSGDFKKIRRRTQTASKDAGPKKRWA